jgi:UDP-glucose 4-epimerase
MKVLITGGAGFIGSHLAERLLENGDTVAVIDNFATARRDNLVPHPNLTVVEGSVADEALVGGVFGKVKPDAVVHAAASYKDPENWGEDSLTNVLGSAIVARACRNEGVGRLIYLQTSLCYGLHPVEQPITFKHPLFSGGYSGGSSYAITKTAGEQFIELCGLDFLSFRLANAYGPRNLSGPLPTFYHRLTNNLPCYVMDTRRDFIYVGDLVEILVKALSGMGKKGFYHISSGSDYSIKEIFDGVVKALGIRLDKEVEVRPRNEDDVYTILLDPAKTNEDFQWKTHTPLEEGIRAAIDWYKEYGITTTYTHLKNILEKK